MKAKRFRFAPVALIAFAGFCAIVMLLWNALLPDIFGVASINFWQAAGLFVLCRLLFGNFGNKGMMMAGMGRHNHIREKWMKMTPEERSTFIEKTHFGNGFFNHLRGTCEEKEKEK